MSFPSTRPPEPSLSVSAAARRLGVAPSTLRTWDRRYGIGPSAHESGRHRRYGADDLARLELMQQALVRGASPAAAARYALDAQLPRPGTEPSDRPWVIAADGSDAAARSGTAGVGDPLLADTDGPGEVGSRVRVGGRVLRLPGAGRRARGLGRAALALDGASARAVLADAIAADGIGSAWEDVAAPVLVAVADRWSSTGAGIEIEHLLSECVTAVFAGATGATPGSQRPVLLVGMPGERHVLPLVVLAAALAGRGVTARSLGADLPADALVAAVRRTAPAAVVLWSQLPATADREVVAGLPRTRPRVRAYVAGPGWADVELPSTVGRLVTLAGAVDALTAGHG